jgi:type IV pilus assembly protein PilM
MRAGIRSRPWAGLDVGSFSVKLLATQGGVGGPRYWLGEAPLGSLDSDPDRPPPAEAVAKAIAECMSLAGLSPRGFRGISLGISGPDVIVKQISLPLLDDNEVAPALRFEARKHLPFDPQSMVIDYQILGRFPSERKLEVLLAAVAQQHVEKHVTPLRMLGLEADILEAAPLALTNAVAHGVELEPGAHILLDVGNAASHLTVYQRGEPYFTRRIEFGGRHLTKAVAEAIQVPFAEAEEWKLAAGSDEPGLRVDWESREMRAVQDCLRRELVEELRRSFAFYRTQARLPEPMRLWISGGSARLPGLATKLGEMLAEPVLLFNPLEAMNGQPRGAAPPGGPQFAQAFGLALRTA